MSQVDGGYSSGDWGGPAAWGCSVYYPLISNAGWGLGAWGSDEWGLGDGGLVSAADTVESLTAFQRNILEAVSASEQVTRPNQNISISISETVTIIDESSGNTAAPINITVSETASVLDAVSSNITTSIISNISETANIADTSRSNATFIVTVNETVNAESILSALGIFVVNVNETSNATDLVFPNGVFAQRVNESVTAQDIVNRRKLWELIDTGTTEDWNLINTY